MADNPNPDHLRGWGAPIPDRLTPEERAAVECVRPTLFQSDFLRIVAALDRIAPKPAAEPIRGTFSVSARSASRYRLGKDIGEVYVQSSIDRPIEVTFRSTDDTPTSDPDREAREALSAAKQHPQWYGAGLTGRLAALRAHGFAHRSEIGRNDPYRGDVELYDYRLHEPDGIYRVRVYGPANPIRRQLERLAEHLHGFAWGYPPKDPPAPPPAAVDVVREALEWAGTNPIRPGYTTVVSDGAPTRIVANETLAQYVERGAAALAARGVTFPQGAR